MTNTLTAFFLLFLTTTQHTVSGSMMPRPDQSAQAHHENLNLQKTIGNNHLPIIPPAMAASCCGLVTGTVAAILPDVSDRIRSLGQN